MEAIAPCRTLYIRNLPENLQKKKLRGLLHAALSIYGRVVWIVAEKTIKLRGQAFVTFEHQASATAALHKMHAAEFMGRQIAVTYARGESDRAGGAAFGGDGELSRKKRAEKRQGEAEAARAAAEAVAGQGDAPGLDEGVVVQDEPPPRMVAPAVPNRILFVENLAKDVGQGGKAGGVAAVLGDLFARFAGFVEVRMVPGKEGIAFVEFGNEAEAAVSMSGLQGHLLGAALVPMKISFAKR